MKIFDILESCVFPLDGNPRLHSATDWEQNIKADSISYPCVFLNRPTPYKPTKIGRFATRQEVYEVKLFFCDKSRPEYTQIQHDEIIEEQRLTVAQFLETLEHHSEVDVIVGEPRCTDIFNLNDQNLDGIWLEFNLRLNIDEGICPQVPLSPSKPIITSISPEDAYNTGVTNCVITGTGFVTGCTVSINGDDIDLSGVVFNDSTNVDFQIDVPSDVKLGVRSITVTNPDGESFTFPDCINILPD